MALAMTPQENAAFLSAEFPQVLGERVLDRLDDIALHLRLAVSARQLRPGGTVRDPRSSRLPMWRPDWRFWQGSVRVRWP